MFTVFKRDGALQPWEYMPAAAGTYHAGQLLAVTGGKLAAITAAKTTTPPYLCMAEATVVAGENLPVIRVDHKMIYETTLSAAAAEGKTVEPGTKLEVSAGGLEADCAAAGSFEVVSTEGTAKGDQVLGRFV